MGYTLYVQVLTVVFLVWNGARIMTCVPVMFGRAQKDPPPQTWRPITWAAWILSNLTFAFTLLENNARISTPILIIGMANAVLCVATCMMIMRHKFRAKALATERKIVHRG